MVSQQAYLPLKILLISHVSLDMQNMVCLHAALPETPQYRAQQALVKAGAEGDGSHSLHSVLQVMTHMLSRFANIRLIGPEASQVETLLPFPF